MADAKKAAKSKSKSKSGTSKGKGKGKGEDAPEVLRVGGHPRAARSVRLTKGWAGLIAFVLTLFLSHRSGVPFYWSALRAVGAGMVVYVVAWGCAVTAWRYLLVAQVEAARLKAMSEQAGADSQAV